MRSTMAMLAGAGGGAVIGGLAVAGVWHGVLPVPQGAVFAIATPAAHVVSWISGWPLQQEAALMCYAVGFAVTIPLVCAAIGAIVGALAAR